MNILSKGLEKIPITTIKSGKSPFPIYPTYSFRNKNQLNIKIILYMQIVKYTL